MFMLILAVLATMIGALIPVSPTEAQLISEQLNQTVQNGVANGTLVQDIFLNNFLLCLAMFIPAAGAAFGLFILFNTGQAFRAIFELEAVGMSIYSSPTPLPGLNATVVPTLSPTPIAGMTASAAFFTLLMIGVVFALEYVSYSVGMAESIWLFRRLSHGNLKVSMRTEVKYLLAGIGLVALLLIIGAVVETFTITTAL
jgi:hypothetical protein